MNTAHIQEYFSYSGNLLGFYSLLEKWSLRQDLIGLTYLSKVYFTLSSQGSFILFIDSSFDSDVIANVVWFIAYLVWHHSKRSILFDITKLLILVIVSHICLSIMFYDTLYLDIVWYATSPHIKLKIKKHDKIVNLMFIIGANLFSSFFIFIIIFFSFFFFCYFY